MPIKILISLFLKLYMNISKLLQKNNHAGKGMKQRGKKKSKDEGVSTQPYRNTTQL